jgi:hypothetical protein
MRDRNTPCGLVVISADGQIRRYHDPIPITGEGAPAFMHVNGAPYELYRYSLFGFGGRTYGFIASLEPPTKEECDQVAAELFGPKTAGVFQLERVGNAGKPAS